MSESEATAQFRELQKTYMETSSKLKQARSVRSARDLSPPEPPRGGARLGARAAGEAQARAASAQALQRGACARR
jgi:hypothetical protein